MCYGLIAWMWQIAKQTDSGSTRNRDYNSLCRLLHMERFFCEDKCYNIGLKPKDQTLQNISFFQE